jgi:hypothetical protein
VASPVELQLHLGRGWLTAETALERVVNHNDANGYYHALGLGPDASVGEIKSAFRSQVKKLNLLLAEDKETFRFLVQIAKVLLNPKKKKDYDSVRDRGAIYLGDMERETLARNGFMSETHVKPIGHEPVIQQRHWACATTADFLPGDDTDAWAEWCREVSPAVGYRGTIMVGVIEGGPFWPCNQSFPWGILTAGSHTFVIFQRGVEPNRLHALCAMIDWQKHLLNQIPHSRKRTPSWL